ncbi:hypothetical protein IKE83_02730 [Candidatus Saccharibacteria bacterium]|nr:hypothetical protein [Candidatus Saccharibacteria bacterium]
MPERRRSKKWIYWVIVLILIVVAGVVGYFVWDGYFRDKEKSEVGQSEVVEKTVEKPAAKEEKQEEGKGQTGEIDGVKEKVEQYDGADPNTAEELTGALTYVSVVDGMLRIRVNIDQFLAGGSCELVLRNGGGILYNEVTRIVDTVSTSTCEGFDVATSGLPVGAAEIVIYLSSGEKVGEITGRVEL